jgi:hypothetical protein
VDHQVLVVWSAVGSSAGLYGLRQLRLYLEYRQRMKFARYVFDRTRSTEGLAGLVELAKAERPIISLRSTPDREPAGERT